ncbi:MAG: glycosyltransferase family 2 protein [Actinomycetota bacterium]
MTERAGERLSIVMPVFNEVVIIEEVLEEVLREIAAKHSVFEIVVVDDASNDGTSEILDAIAAREDGVIVHHADVNRGHGATLRRAIEATTGEWIFHVDSDGQFVLNEFWRLWDERHEADLILGVRANRRDPFHRRVLSVAVRWVASLLAMRSLRDPNVPFKLFRQALWNDLRPFVGEEVLAPSILLSVGASLRNWRVCEVPVSHLPRQHGRSSLRPGRLLTLSLRGFVQLIRFRYRARRIR